MVLEGYLALASGARLLALLLALLTFLDLRDLVLSHLRGSVWIPGSGRSWEEEGKREHTVAGTGK